MLFGLLEPMVSKIGGPQIWKDVDNLVPGAWEHPAMLQALNMMKALHDNGYIMEGTPETDPYRISRRSGCRRKRHLFHAEPG